VNTAAGPWFAQGERQRIARAAVAQVGGGGPPRPHIRLREREQQHVDRIVRRRHRGDERLRQLAMGVARLYQVVAHGQAPGLDEVPQKAAQLLAVLRFSRVLAGPDRGVAPRPHDRRGHG
jgi:hypothetical protein